jgi:hypothetical protein
VATVYLDPGDVPAADARRVLDALNAATSARELDVAIEFPGEPDIGVKLGQRLLDRRDELGGYADLQQVRDVRLIGPERFTEIVVALSGRSVFELLGVAGVAGGAVGRPQPPATLDLAVHGQGPYLGQLTTVVVTATVDGRRRPGIEVLLTTGTGRLRAVTGGRVAEGAAIPVVTAQDGTVRATWSPNLEPSLPSTSRAALAVALGSLSPEADAPIDTLDGLRALVAAYRWEPNTELRHAVDALTAGQAGLAGLAGLTDEAGAVDLARAWPRQDDTITAYLLATGTAAAGGAGAVQAAGGTVQAVAVRALALRDWRAALLRVHHDVVREEARLTSHLDTEKRESSDPADLVGRVQRRLGDFLDVQRGRLGTDVARAVAVEATRSFVLERTADLSLDGRLQVTPLLAATAGTVGAASPAVARALTETRSTVIDRVDERVASELPPLRAEVGDLAERVTSKVDRASFDQAMAGTIGRAELDRALAGTIDRTSLEEALADRVDRATLEAALARTVDHATLEQLLGRFVDRKELDQVLAGTIDRATLEEALARTVDHATLEKLLERFVDRRVLDRVLADHVVQEEFHAFVEETSARLARLEGRR